MAAFLISRRGALPRRSLLALSVGALFSQPAFAADPVSADAPILFWLPQANSTNSVAMSADGSTVIGTFTMPSGTPAFRWTSATGIEQIGALGGNNASPTAVNADGSVIVGNTGGGAFRWTSATGMQLLGTFGGNASDAKAVSADGAVIVGTSDLSGSSEQHAFRWTATTGMVDLGTLGGTSSTANAVNADGSVVVGTATTVTETRAFRWTSGAGMQNLGSLGGSLSDARAVSADGSAVAGIANTATSATRAFRWTSATGMQDLGTLGGSDTYFGAMSSDGSTVVGGSLTQGNPYMHAFRWTNATGMVDLGTLGGPLSAAVAVNANGAVVAGMAYNAQGDSRIFRWTSATGMQDLVTLLTNAGVNMRGIILSSVTGISANGQYIAGDGGTPATSGVGQVYLVRYIDATVSPKPNPDPDPSGTPGSGSTPTTPSTPSTPATSSPPANPVIAGITTPSSVQASANQVGKARQSVMGQMHGFADQMLGEGKISDSPSGVAAFGAVGSLAAGITGHLNLAPFELVAGVGYASESYADTEMRGAFTAAAKLRYAHMFDERFGWFGELGGFFSPDSNYRFSRNYANGSGTATGSASASGRQAYGFGRLGMLINVTANDQLTQSIELGRQVLRTSSYSEVLSPGNPFEASMGASSSTMNLLKIREKWVHAFTSTVDAAVWGAWAHGFSYRDGSRLNVSGVGSLSPQVSSQLNWFEYGARVGYKMSRKAKVSAFVNGVSGGDVGSRTHVGVNFEMFF
ncbi:hypothetical protein EIL82_11705 [Pandoraea apista]|uniref:HAF family extracellular repeat-containing protein n=2 Tax=Pandoraea apista TaxID=93218 RepID=A0ABX9ZTW3_9BURK|nr:hypothetical protein C7830_00615 [Pandoraea apista]RRJ31231.1 hypothetical protein EIB05_12585 [Pandoraea apista]RRJ79900.1 hypothetical protein EIL82_11705 [Pandoraea apista]RSD11346.1 hypothetical protein EJB12_12590 [Pandoraea apista]RSD15799.1 hypothetical protein EIZ52_16130 [Pandoraea apista]